MLPGIAGILYVVSSLSILPSGIYYPWKLLCHLVGLRYNRKNTPLCSKMHICSSALAALGTLQSGPSLKTIGPYVSLSNYPSLTRCCMILNNATVGFYCIKKISQVPSNILASLICYSQSFRILNAVEHSV